MGAFMIFGLTLYTFVHVLISLIAIVAGLVVLYGLLHSDRMNSWTSVFFLFTVATTLTGFGFPFVKVTPAFTLGILSTIVLIVALSARYAFRMMGIWRSLYVISSVIALYLNCFVLVVQSFQKLPALHALAPNGSEPPFAIAQGIVLLFFIVTGYMAVRRFHPRPV